jgi:hypothetical protein
VTAKIAAGTVLPGDSLEFEPVIQAGNGSGISVRGAGHFNISNRDSRIRSFCDIGLGIHIAEKRRAS